ncbi:hypothetical protein PPYR_05996 [Photinus pyralis]|uniref:Lipid-binding serum glycoprotein N-terminal domain-containing protein n=1 Tax=Photinus pyralis TaxID=7054 RepID=A0A5N4ASG4_PHOPY|nr:uncharacterized protein LOC116167007 [Photinus pyralis]KAB0800256.1 hypothetical protein PPYR_05996 [Photinus pyralis]
MKLLHKFIVFAICFTYPALGESMNMTLLRTNSRIFENEIKQGIECLKQIIKEGISGVSLDPFRWPMFPLDIHNDVISSNLLLSNILFDGLSGFVADPASLNVIIWGGAKLSAKFGLTFDSLNLGTNYDGSLKLMQMINLFGTGKFKLLLKQLQLGLEFEIGINPIKISQFEAKIGLPSTQCEVTGLFHDEYLSKIITGQMEDTLNSLAIEQQSALNTLINEKLAPIIEMINKSLANLSLQDVINLVTGNGSKGDSPKDCKLAFFKGFSFLNEQFPGTFDHYYKWVQ